MCVLKEAKRLVPTSFVNWFATSLSLILYAFEILTGYKIL